MTTAKYPLGVRCFMIEPVLGEPLPKDDYFDRTWPPRQHILRWRNPRTGEEREHPHQFQIGAMWYCSWFPINHEWSNETGPHLIVKCPNGRDWDIDSRCNNCKSPKDTTHRCWLRHGVSPLITVDKVVGEFKTCAAGGGSIMAGDYHGFLKNGVFVP